MGPEQWNQYCRFLATGPVVFGEHHSMPTARDSAMYLIQYGLVKKLFVERAECPINGQEPGQILRDHAAKVREGALDFNDPVSEIGLAPANMGAGDNPTTWQQVVRYAAACGVDVFYFDKSVHGEPGSEQNMVIRNDGMAKVFNENTEGIGIGMLMINGSDHVNFEGEGGQLSRACKIEDERVFIFPKEYSYTQASSTAETTADE